MNNSARHALLQHVASVHHIDDLSSLYAEETQAQEFPGASDAVMHARQSIASAASYIETFSQPNYRFTEGDVVDVGVTVRSLQDLVDAQNEQGGHRSGFAFRASRFLADRAAVAAIQLFERRLLKACERHNAASYFWASRDGTWQNWVEELPEMVAAAVTRSRVASPAQRMRRISAQLQLMYHGLGRILFASQSVVGSRSAAHLRWALAAALLCAWECTGAPLSDALHELAHMLQHAKLQEADAIAAALAAGAGHGPHTPPLHPPAGQSQATSGSVLVQPDREAVLPSARLISQASLDVWRAADAFRADSRVSFRSLAPRPAWQRQWWRVLLAAGTVATVGVAAARNWEGMRARVSSAAESIRAFYSEHLREPLAAMSQEVLRSEPAELREGDATEAALQDATVSMQNMLQQWLNSKHSAGELPASGDGTQFSAEQLHNMAQAMDLQLLSRQYEAEIQHPLRSAVAGDLVQLMLMQVQFIKVEALQQVAAMEGILRQNHFNTQVLATIPAVIVGYVSLQAAAAALRRLGQWVPALGARLAPGADLPAIRREMRHLCRTLHRLVTRAAARKVSGLPATVTHASSARVGGEGGVQFGGVTPSLTPPLSQIPSPRSQRGAFSAPPPAHTPPRPSPPPSAAARGGWEAQSSAPVFGGMRGGSSTNQAPRSNVADKLRRDSLDSVALQGPPSTLPQGLSGAKGVQGGVGSDIASMAAAEAFIASMDHRTAASAGRTGGDSMGGGGSEARVRSGLPHAGVMHLPPTPQLRRSASRSAAPHDPLSIMENYNATPPRQTFGGGALRLHAGPSSKPALPSNISASADTSRHASPASGVLPLPVSVSGAPQPPPSDRADPPFTSEPRVPAAPVPAPAAHRAVSPPPTTTQLPAPSALLPPDAEHSPPFVGQQGGGVARGPAAALQRVQLPPGRQASSRLGGLRGAVAPPSQGAPPPFSSVAALLRRGGAASSTPPAAAVTPEEAASPPKHSSPSPAPAQPVAPPLPMASVPPPTPPQPASASRPASKPRRPGAQRNIPAASPGGTRNTTLGAPSSFVVVLPGQGVLLSPLVLVAAVLQGALADTSSGEASGSDTPSVLLAAAHTANMVVGADVGAAQVPVGFAAAAASAGSPSAPMAGLPSSSMLSTYSGLTYAEVGEMVVALQQLTALLGRLRGSAGDDIGVELQDMLADAADAVAPRTPLEQRVSTAARLMQAYSLTALPSAGEATVLSSFSQALGAVI